MLASSQNLYSRGAKFDEDSEFLPFESSMVEYTQIQIGEDQSPGTQNPTLDDDAQSFITTSTIYLPNQDTVTKNRYRDKSPRVSIINYKRYRLAFVLRYDSKPGESVSVVGNTGQLGHMTDYQLCPLTLKKGSNNVWQSSQIEFEKFCTPFQYKYVIIHNGMIKQMEKGFNRVADLEILPDQSMVLSQQSTSGQSSKSGKSANSIREFKECIIEDEWQSYKIKFSVYDPLEENSKVQEDHMSLVGLMQTQAADGKVKVEKTPPIRMTRSQIYQNWMFTKYGSMQKPWELTLTFKSDQVQLPLEIFYFYSKRKNDGSHVVREREPNRSLVLMPPESYENQLEGQGNSHQSDEKVWILNGIVDKTDANFMGGLFFDKIGDTNIVIGTYPLNERDILKMQDIGITAVINLQTDEEFEQRKINWKNIKDLYKKNNIKCYRFPINDQKEDQYCASLFVGAQHVNSLINVQNENMVFIHCSSGMSRAPAVVITYLLLFKRVKQWQSTSLVAQYVKAFHVNSCPNLRAINKTVQNNLQFQRQQMDVYGFVSSRSISPQKLAEEGSEMFYLPQQMGSRAQKDQSISPSRRYTPIKGGYSKKLFQRSSQYNSRNTDEHKATTPDASIKQQSFNISHHYEVQSEQRKEEVSKFNYNKASFVAQPIMQEGHPIVVNIPTSNSEVVPSHDNSMISDGFRDDDTVIISQDFVTSVKKDLRDYDRSDQKILEYSPYENKSDENSVKLNNIKKKLNNGMKVDRLRQHLNSTLNNKELLEKQNYEKQNEIGIMTAIEAEDKARQKELARITAEEERQRKEEELRRLEDLARIVASEERKRKMIAIEQERIKQIKMKAELKRIRDQLEVDSSQVLKSLIENQVFKLAREVNTELQEERQRQWRLETEKETERQAKVIVDARIQQQIEERQRLIMIEKKQRGIEQQIQQERMAIMQEVQNEISIESKNSQQQENFSPTRFMSFKQRQEQNRRKQELENIQYEKLQINQQKREREKQLRRDKERLEREEHEFKLQNQRSEKKRDEERKKSTLLEESMRQKILDEVRRRQKDEDDRLNAEEEKRRQIEMMKREEEELLATRLAKKAEEKRLRDQKQIEAHKYQEQEKLKEAQDQLESLRQQRHSEQQKLNELRDQYELEAKERIERTADIKRQLEDKMKESMMHHTFQAKIQNIPSFATRNPRSTNISPIPSNQMQNRTSSFSKSDVSQQNISATPDSDMSMIDLPFNKREQHIESIIVDQSLNDKRIDYYCNQIFYDAPIKFTPQRGNQVDECLGKLIRKFKITTPIIRIRDQEKMYLLGTQKFKMEFKYQSIFIKTGAYNTEKFDSFVPKSQRKYQRQIIEFMSKSQKNFYDVMEMLYRGQKIYTQSSIPKMVSLGLQSPSSPVLQKQAFGEKLKISLDNTNLKYVPVKNVKITSDRSESGSERGRSFRSNREQRLSSASSRRWNQFTNAQSMSSPLRGNSYHEPASDPSSPTAKFGNQTIESKWTKLHHLKKVNINLQSRDGSVQSRGISNDSRSNNFNQEQRDRVDKGSTNSLTSMSEHHLTGKFGAANTPRIKTESLQKLVNQQLKNSRHQRMNFGGTSQNLMQQHEPRFFRFQGGGGAKRME